MEREEGSEAPSPARNRGLGGGAMLRVREKERQDGQKDRKENKTGQ